MGHLRTALILSALLLIILAAGCERKIVNEVASAENQNCFTCHGEEGLLLAAKGEWQNSIHASGNNVDYTNREGSDCTQCHDHQGFLDFLATGEVEAPYDNVSAIHCFTCHSPHVRGDLTLRIDDPYTLINGEVFDHGSANLCANCHHARTSVETVVSGVSVSRYWGPHHGPQSDLLIGTGGYEFSGQSYGSSPHASVGGNNGCILCHMGQPRTHTGYKVGGHTFNMVDEESGEDLVGVCQECHESAEDYDYDGVQTEVESLLEELAVLLQGEGILDGSGSTISQTISDENLAGALWNYKTIEEDRSHGIHNPEYIIDLLETSISYVESLSAGKKVMPAPIASH